MNNMMPEEHLCKPKRRTVMLTVQQIEDLKKFDTPTISNGIEFFGVRSRSAGFTNSSIRKVFADDKRIVGYACTAKISAQKPPTEPQKKLQNLYYGKVKDAPKPTIAVLEDIDPQPTGAFWGEVQVTMHRSLGCVGTVTNGGVRDLDEVKNLKFEYFSSCLLVSHVFVHVEAVDCAVSVGGLIIHPGDLIHADKHGVIVIPAEVAPYLSEACRAAQDAETPVLSYCRKHFPKGDADPERIEACRSEMNDRRAKYAEKFSAVVKKGN
jgi:4-hydroxy-4-methyl-2-oxoglutarate aldolase